MVTFDDINIGWRYDMGIIDIRERLSDAVDQLSPDYQSPAKDLFALDGLGREPRVANTRGDADA
jgi:hypothetical protein